jgi:uroporphyrinogen decarboxylase
MVEMTSRERVITTLEHREPDRVPLDIGAGYSTSISVEGYDRLRQHLGISKVSSALDSVFRIARVDDEVMQRLGCDCYPIVCKSPLNWTPPSTAPDQFIDLFGVTWKRAYYDASSYYMEVHKSPLANARIEDLDDYPWPDPLDPGFTDGLGEDTRIIHQETEYALMADSGFKSFWETGYLLRGYQQLLVDLVRNPEFVTALFSKLSEINLAATGRFLDEVGRYIHVFRTGDDLASQSGLIMSPAMFRKTLKPFYIGYIDLIKSKTNAKIFFHSCGNIVRLIDELVETGVDIINPVQVSAMGDTAALKAGFGEKVSFWGGIDTQHVLPGGSVDDVRTEVRRRIRDLGPGGGFVLAAVHNIQADVPPQNILAMAGAVKEFGKYPLAV